MNPAPPVTRTLRLIPGLQAEQLLQRFEEPGPATGSGRLLEGHRGVVQELVEQRLAELLDLRAVLRREVRQALQRALELRRADIVEPLTDLFEGRYDRQPPVPGPEPLRLVAHDALSRRNLLPALRRR